MKLQYVHVRSCNTGLYVQSNYGFHTRRTTVGFLDGSSVGLADGETLGCAVGSFVYHCI